MVSRFQSLFLSAVPLVILAGSTSHTAQAGQLAYEGFNLTFPAYSSGVGFDGPWIKGGFNVSAAGYAASDGSLFYVNGHGNAGSQGTSQNDGNGNAGLLTGGGSISSLAFQEINGAIRPLWHSLGADNTMVYISFLIQPRGTLNTGIYNGFFGVTLNGSLGNDLFIGKPGAGAQTQYVIESRGGSGQFASGAPAVIGQTALLVVKAQFLHGLDIFTLYINPFPGGPEPSPAAFKTDLDLGTVSAIGIYSSGAFSIDEIRIGTTFADVTPSANPSGN